MVYMDKLKFALFSVVVLALVGIVGYWSVNTIQSGTEYVKDQKIKQLEKENKDLKTEAEKQKSELNALQSKLEQLTPSVKPEPIVYKYQDLMDELQKLASDNVSLKQKSRGPKVGTVQKFLNIYNNTSNKVDNDYGASTAKLVTAFQKAEGLTADGEASLNTFNKMIDWLKKQ